MSQVFLLQSDLTVELCFLHLFCPIKFTTYFLQIPERPLLGSRLQHWKREQGKGPTGTTELNANRLIKRPTWKQLQAITYQWDVYNQVNSVCSHTCYYSTSPLPRQTVSPGCPSCYCLAVYSVNFCFLHSALGDFFSQPVLLAPSSRNVPELPQSK